MTRTRRLAATAAMAALLTLTGTTPADALAPRGMKYSRTCVASAFLLSPAIGIVCRWNAEIRYQY